MKTKFTENFRAARLVGTPLVAVNTPDPSATLSAIKEVSAAETPILAWDAIRGLRSWSDAGAEVMASINQDETLSITRTLELAEQFPANTVVAFYNLQLFIKEPAVIQGVWNLRDGFKQNFRTLVALSCDMQLPLELHQDVLVLDEPLPGSDELKAIVMECYEAAELKAPTEEVIEKAIDATCGLASFPAEQVVAMSLTTSGLDLDALWERKRKMIEQVKGLSVYRGKDRLDDVQGLPNVVKFMKMIAAGKKHYRGIVFVDEIDKHMANVGAAGTGDTTAEMLGPVLSFMEDNEIEGVIFTGVSGTGKTMLAKALGNELGAPTLVYDFSGMKASHVGESGANVRAANKVANAVSQNNLLFVATCNNMANLPPEFRRRFTLGTFFFDLPSQSALEASWRYYVKKYKVKKQELPKHDGWTPAEIRNCCRTADNLGVSLIEAAKYIVPVSRAGASKIEAMRREATGAYLDTVRDGLYQFVAPSADEAKSGRKINVGGVA